MKVIKKRNVKRKLRREIGPRQRRKILKVSESNISVIDFQAKKLEMICNSLLNKTQHCSESKGTSVSNIQDLFGFERENNYQLDHCFSHFFESDGHKLDSFENHSSNKIYRIEYSFQTSLAQAFLQGNFTHVQGNLILKILRSHQCLSYLPMDTRTLLQTMRRAPQTKNVSPGEYLHLGFEYALTRILKRTPINLIPDMLHVDWSTDGVRLNNSGKLQLWPIQISVCNISECKPEVIGVYKGKSKPISPGEFLDDFINEVNTLIQKGGIFFMQKLIPIELRILVVDAVAKAYLLNHFSHVSKHPCSRCHVIGFRYEKQIVFPGTIFRLRTNEEYVQMLDENHHKGSSVISRLQMGLVSQVPGDAMHIAYEGVQKKFFEAIVNGKYGKTMKLCLRDINLISERLNMLSKYCPREFNRKPRCLKEFHDYKATEFRQFALYTGPVVMYGIIPNDGYLHYLLFHAALRSISQSNGSTVYLRFAEIALKEFVEKCPHFYKLSFVSYNVHALLHFVQDVKLFGPLDSFSVFQYENNVAFFKKMYRKPSLPLQQIALRLAEKEKLEQVVPDTEHIIKVSVPHDNGPILAELGFVYMQYRKIQMKNMFLGIDFAGDKCCILKDLCICLVYNILKTKCNMYYLIVKKFKTANAFYDIGLSSTCLGIYKCTNLCSNYEVISIHDVKHKCYLMPYWYREEQLLVSNSSDSDSENAKEPSKNILIAAVII